MPNDETTSRPTGIERLGMILSAYDQIAMDRCCESERVCSTSSAGFRLQNCGCYQTAMMRVDRDIENGN